MTKYHLRPLRLKDAKIFQKYKILGSYPTIKSCEDQLRLRLKIENSAHFVLVDGHDTPIFYLADSQAAENNYLRMLSLYTPDPLEPVPEEIATAFEHEVLNYLKSQAESVAVYLLLGAFADILGEDSLLPYHRLGEIPLVSVQGTPAAIHNLWIHQIDLRETVDTYYAFYPTKHSLFILTADQEGILSLSFHDLDKPVTNLIERRWGQSAGVLNEQGIPVSQDAWVQENAPQHLYDAVEQLDEYFAGTRTQFDLPLKPSGTPFQMQVWKALQEIPYGQPVSYLDVSEKISENSHQAHLRTRAVGAACGANPLPVFIPCHRVLSIDGKLHGFSGGVELKGHLLNHEILGHP